MDRTSGLLLFLFLSIKSVEAQCHLKCDHGELINDTCTCDCDDNWEGPECNKTGGAGAADRSRSWYSELDTGLLVVLVLVLVLAVAIPVAVILCTRNRESCEQNGSEDFHHQGDNPAFENISEEPQT